MASEERLITLQNVSDEPIEGSWDARAYTFAPHEAVTLVYGIGLHFHELHPAALVIETESRGEAPDTIVVEAHLKNVGDVDLDVAWDGRTYHFPVGEAVALDSSLVTTMVVQARAYGGSLEPVDMSVVPNASPEAAPAKKPRKPRAKKPTE